MFGTGERIGIQILAEDFAAFKKLMPSEARLASNFEEWIQRRQAEDLMASGGVKRVTVRPEEFAAYCREARRKPTYLLLEAFAVRKALSER